MTGVGDMTGIRLSIPDRVPGKPDRIPGTGCSTDPGPGVRPGAKRTGGTLMCVLQRVQKSTQPALPPNLFPVCIYQGLFEGAPHIGFEHVSFAYTGKWSGASLHDARDAIRRTSPPSHSDQPKTPKPFFLRRKRMTTRSRSVHTTTINSP